MPTAVDLNFTVIKSIEQLDELVVFIKNNLITGFDIETNFVDSLFLRKIRTMQIGTKEKQFVIDLKYFADDLNNQGNCVIPLWFKPIYEALSFYFKSNKFIKVGHNIQFECECLNWCLGVKIYGLYCCLIVEKLLNAGKVRYTDKGFFGLDDIALRRCKFEMDKTYQTSFNLEDELSNEQIYYAALDTRVPLAIRASQLKEAESLNLLKIVEIENNAIPFFSDLFVNGFYLNSEIWLNTVSFYKEKHKKNVEILDTYFIPIFGKKKTKEEFEEQLEKINEAENKWRSEKTSKNLRAELRSVYQEANRLYKKELKDQEKFEGNAKINYASNEQILLGLNKLGIKIKDTNDNTLSLILNQPVIKAIQDFRATAKIISTYGDSWLKYINPITGLVHSNINQLGAETGRTSSSSPNCFPEGTEVLTRQGWKKFESLSEIDEVAQYWSETNNIDFTKPTAYIKYYYEGNLVNIKTDQQLDFLCTPNHNCLLVNRKTEETFKIPAYQYKIDSKQIQAGVYVGGNKTLTSDEVILLCAFQADAHYDKKNHRVSWGFKKERKINRLKQTLNSLNIQYTSSIDKRGVTRIGIKKSDVPSWLVDKKVFGSWLLDFDFTTLKLFEREVWFWDGRHKENSQYSASIKINADWVQTICCLTNRRANIREFQNKTSNSKLNWIVQAGSNNYSLTSGMAKTYIPYIGNVYCVSVASTNIIVRQNNKIIITGNCANIPHNEVKGEPNFHYAFTARKDGRKLVIIDMAGAELRILAEMSKYKLFLDAFANGEDVHSIGAEIIFGKRWWASQEAGCAFAAKKAKCNCYWHKILRGWVKAINFGIAYGMQAKKLASELSIPVEDAQKILDDYCATFVGLIQFLTWLGNQAKMNLLSRDLGGRIRWFDKPSFERAKELLEKTKEEYEKEGKVFNITQARIKQKYMALYASVERQGKNAPIQGLNATILKTAAGAGYCPEGKPYLWHTLQEYDALFSNTVYDELVIDCPEEHAEKVYALVGDAIERAGAEYMKSVKMAWEGSISFDWRK